LSQDDFKEEKRYGQSISVYQDVKDFFDWMDATGRKRKKSDLVREAIKQHPLFKKTYQQHLKEKKDG